MELDFKSIKALSSPTRIRILHLVIDKELTPTQISDKTGKSKSTVCSHLETLVNADLVHKDEKKGRKRVLYKPTDKARDIVKGKERNVKFSVTSSVLSALAGVSLIATNFLSGTEDADGMEMSADQEELAVEEESHTILESIVSLEPEILIGSFLIILALMILVYGLWIRKIAK